MNVERHAALRTLAERGVLLATGPYVPALLDEIAELRCGLERVRDGIEGHPYDIAVATLARADAIGDDE